MAVYQIPPNGNWCASIPGINWEFRALQEQITALQNAGTASQTIYIPLEYPGVLADETLFGYWQAPAACELLGTILYIAEPSVGNDITIDYTNSGGTEQGKVSTLAAGSEFQLTTFGSPLVLATGNAIRAKTKSIGSSTTEGAFLTAFAIIQYT